MFGSNLFFYKLLFAVEIFVAEFLFTFHLKKRSYFVLRFAVGVAAVLGLAAAFPVIDNSPWYSSMMFLVIFGGTVPVLKLCYDEPWINIVFCSMAAYTLQHFSYEFSNLLLSLVIWGRSPMLGMYDSGDVEFWEFTKEAAFYFLMYLLCYVLAYWLIYILFGKRIKKGQDMKFKSMTLLMLIGAGLLTDIVLNSFVVYTETEVTAAVISYLTNMLCCVLLLYCQFGLLLTKELRHELEFVHRLWHQEKEQYAISKENIDLINLKCHDMKNQIREIGKSKSLEHDTIAEIEKTISLYDSIVKTGNEPLDIILTEKSLRCHKNGITLSCIADGTLLNFMNAADIYSLFGNALDNALEAVLKIDKSDSRIIGLRIHAVGELITVNINNSFDGGAIVYDEHGFPVTTKGDSLYHGYGVKSIAYIVDKYDANMSIVVKNGMFHLNILIPSPGHLP